MIAHEQTIRAYLEVLSNVILYLRLNSRGPSGVSGEQLHDLMDAIHNVPELLTKPDGYFTSVEIRNGRFADYDAKWAKETGLGLVALLDKALEKI